MSFSTLSLAAFGAGAACIAAAPAGTFRRPSNARRMQDDTGAVDGAAAGATGTPYVSFCPSIQGTDSGMWADLYNVEETNNYQALFYISQDNGTTWSDRTLGNNTYASTNYTGLPFGYAGFVYIDAWAKSTLDRDANAMAMYVVPVEYDLKSYVPPEVGAIPAAIINASLCFDLEYRTTNLPKCAEDIITTPVPVYTDPDLNTTNGTGDEAAASVKASGAIRNGIVTSALAAVVAAAAGFVCKF